MAAPAAKEFALAAPPGDGVSSLRFSPVDASTLLCASWDGGVRLYDTAANALRATGTASKAPVLDATFSPDGGAVYAAGLDRVVRM
jgi:cell cycle arrest protein BUB3